jgi:hypothetical protein
MFNSLMVNDEKSVKSVGTEIDVDVTDTAGALVTAAQIPANCEFACITNALQPIMIRFDGGTPTTTVGAYKLAGAVMWVHRTALANAKAIRQGGTSSVCHVSFWTR